MGYIKGPLSSKDRELPLFLRLCETDFPQHRIRRPEGMPFWQLFYGVEGIGEFRFADKKYRLLPGHTALLFPNVSHSYSPLSEEWQVHFLGFEGNARAQEPGRFCPRSAGRVRGPSRRVTPRGLRREAALQSRRAPFRWRRKARLNGRAGPGPCTYIHTSCM